MVNLYEDYQLPRKYQAILKIREQPYWYAGPDSERNLAIRWCASHRFWLVGTLVEVMEGLHRFNREYLEFLKNHGLQGEVFPVG